MEKSCPICSVDKNIPCFDIEANKIAKNESITPEEKHQKIAEERVKARNNGCRNLNNVDPVYPGKNLL